MRKTIALLLILVVVCAVAAIQGQPVEIVKAMTGSGTAGDPYMIYNLDDLQEVRYMSASAHYELANDIDASASTSLNGENGLLAIAGDVDGGIDWQEFIPTSDNGQTGSWAITPNDGTYYDKVDDPPTYDETTYLTASAASSRALFGFDTPTVPAGATAITVGVMVMSKDSVSGTNTMRACLQVGGNIYNSGTFTPEPSWDDDYLYWGGTNPKTSANWTVDDINGVSDNALQLFGCEAVDASPSIMVTQVALQISFYPPTPTTDTVFTGVFNGAGHTISNLRMWRFTASECIGQGIFAGIGVGAVVANVTLSNVDFDFGMGTARCYNGVLIGTLEDGPSTITNCHVIGGTFKSGDQSGAIVGMGYDEGTISYCSSNLTCTLGAESGGLIGWAGWFPSMLLTVENCWSASDITAHGTVDQTIIGGLIGFMDHGAISSCYATGDVTSDEDFVGGFMGWFQNGTITDCYATGDVTSTSGGQSGGFVGYIYDEGGSSYVKRCYSTGTVTCYLGYTGGFAGVNDAIVEECFATGDVSITSGGEDSIGGFAGLNFGSITNCYTRSDVTTIDVWDYDIGGFTGYNAITIGNVTNCYSTGLITTPSSDDVGGLCGDNRNVVSTSFWDTQTSGYMTSDGGTGKTTAEMTTEDTFTDASWDFTVSTGVWCMPDTGCNDDYPILQNNLPPEGCYCYYPSDAMFEVWSPVVSESDWPNFLQAVPSILLILYLIIMFAGTILMLRPKKQESLDV